MKPITSFILFALFSATTTLACSSSGGAGDTNQPSGSGPSSGDIDATPDGGGSSDSLSDGGSSSEGGASCGSTLPVAPMPLISKGAPVFASTGDATGANTNPPASAWTSSSIPAWVAYDLSAAPIDERQNVLVSWYAIHAPCYIDTAQNTDNQRPTAYTIETNDAPGGGSPPASDWKQIVSEPSNIYCGRQHAVAMNGANWMRMSVTQSSSTSTVSFALDVQSAPTCTSDAWLFMGDSITYMTMTHAFCDLPELVQTAKPMYWPAVIDAAIGGTSTVTAAGVIDDTMKDFPGQFVVLAYGTNDHASTFQMETLVQHVIAAGKTPVVPHMPWSASATEGPAINQQIDALYAKYPQIVKGPDLWALFDGRTDLIPADDIHPNAAGQEVLRQAWATTMEGLYQ